MVKKKQSKKSPVKSKKVETKKTEKKSNGINNAPITVKIISILHYVNAAIWAIIGLLLIFGAGAMISYILESSPELQMYSSGTLTGVLIFVGIFLIGFGVLNFFIGRGLWKLKNWAKIIAVVFGAIGVFTGIYSMVNNFVFTQIVSLLIDLTIVIYLLFCKEARKAFGK